MLGSTPAEAITRYVEGLQRSLDCVTTAVARPQSYHVANEPRALVVNGDRPFPFDDGSIPVSLQIAEQYIFRQDLSAHATMRWRVEIAGYWYYLLERETEQELISFHWHPRAPDGSSATMRLPHFHIRSRLLSPLGMQFGNTHLPTGPLPVAAVVWYAITQLGVRPRRKDWLAVLAANWEYIL